MAKFSAMNNDVVLDQCIKMEDSCRDLNLRNDDFKDRFKGVHQEDISSPNKISVKENQDPMLQGKRHRIGYILKPLVLHSGKKKNCVPKLPTSDDNLSPVNASNNNQFQGRFKAFNETIKHFSSTLRLRRNGNTGSERLKQSPEKLGTSNWNKLATELSYVSDSPLIEQKGSSQDLFALPSTTSSQDRANTVRKRLNDVMKDRNEDLKIEISNKRNPVARSTVCKNFHYLSSYEIEHDISQTLKGASHCCTKLNLDPKTSESIVETSPLTPVDDESIFDAPFSDTPKGLYAAHVGRKTLSRLQRKSIDDDNTYVFKKILESSEKLGYSESEHYEPNVTTEVNVRYAIDTLYEMINMHLKRSDILVDDNVELQKQLSKKETECASLESKVFDETSKSYNLQIENDLLKRELEEEIRKSAKLLASNHEQRKVYDEKKSSEHNDRYNSISRELADVKKECKILRSHNQHLRKIVRENSDSQQYLTLKKSSSKRGNHDSPNISPLFGQASKNSVSEGKNALSIDMSQFFKLMNLNYHFRMSSLSCMQQFTTYFRDFVSDSCATEYNVYLRALSNMDLQAQDGYLKDDNYKIITNQISVYFGTVAYRFMTELHEKMGLTIRANDFLTKQLVGLRRDLEDKQALIIKLSNERKHLVTSQQMVI